MGTSPPGLSTTAPSLTPSAQLVTLVPAPGQVSSIGGVTTYNPENNTVSITGGWPNRGFIGWQVAGGPITYAGSTDASGDLGPLTMPTGFNPAYGGLYLWVGIYPGGRIGQFGVFRWLIQPAAPPPPPPPTASGLLALIANIMASPQPLPYSAITDPALLQGTTPYGPTTVPNSDYATSQFAYGLAQILGQGALVVSMPPYYAPDETWPVANFIKLPNGMTFLAASVGYYFQFPQLGQAQLLADLTQTINEGSALTVYFQSEAPTIPGGPAGSPNPALMPNFPVGYIGPPIPGMTYPPGSIGSDGNVINPSTVPAPAAAAAPAALPHAS